MCYLSVNKLHKILAINSIKSWIIVTNYIIQSKLSILILSYIKTYLHFFTRCKEDKVSLSGIFFIYFGNFVRFFLQRNWCFGPIEPKFISIYCEFDISIIANNKLMMKQSGSKFNTAEINDCNLFTIILGSLSYRLYP